MSEVERYSAGRLCKADGSLISNVLYFDVVMASDYDAIQSELAVLHGLCEDRFNELAALREELADSESDNEAIADHNIELQQRLTAAEQRNAELEKDAARYRWLRDINVGPATIDRLIFQTVADDCNPPYRDMKHGVDLDAAIDSQIKPTESGASE